MAGKQNNLLVVNNPNTLQEVPNYTNTLIHRFTGPVIKRSLYEYFLLYSIADGSIQRSNMLDGTLFHKPAYDSLVKKEIMYILGLNEYSIHQKHIETAQYADAYLVNCSYHNVIHCTKSNSVSSPSILYDLINKIRNALAHGNYNKVIYKNKEFLTMLQHPKENNKVKTDKVVFFMNVTNGNEPLELLNKYIEDSVGISKIKFISRYLSRQGIRNEVLENELYINDFDMNLRIYNEDLEYETSRVLNVIEEGKMLFKSDSKYPSDIEDKLRYLEQIDNFYRNKIKNKTYIVVETGLYINVEHSIRLGGLLHVISVKNLSKIFNLTGEFKKQKIFIAEETKPSKKQKNNDILKVIS